MAFTSATWSSQIKSPDSLVEKLASPTAITDRKLYSSASSKWSANVKEPQKPRPIVVCGPSGSGKSTLLKRLMEEFNDYFGFSVSHTTRKPRIGEVNGKDYHYTERSEMIEAIKNGEFIEYAEFSGNIYGTSKRAVQEVLERGRICMLDVEMEGVKNLKKTDLNPRFIFIKPPSMSILEERLRKRGTDSEEAVRKRLARAMDELAYGEISGNFDVVIVNDEIDVAYTNLRDFILQDIEELKKSRGM
ncbi:Guanylate kinase [Halotydeus destructor]|nr:Guanylate kinase [Halotydeus destructor]